MRFLASSTISGWSNINLGQPCVTAEKKHLSYLVDPFALKFLFGNYNQFFCCQASRYSLY